MLEKLRQRFKHCCMNCKYFQPYGEINYGEVDCELNVEFDSPEYYYDYNKSNACDKFEYESRDWKEGREE